MYAALQRIEAEFRLALTKFYAMLHGIAVREERMALIGYGSAALVFGLLWALVTGLIQ